MKEITIQGDPMIRVQLPEIVICMLKSNARKNKRRFQDEFIKRMSATLKNEVALQNTFQKLLPDLQTIYKN